MLHAQNVKIMMEILNSQRKNINNVMNSVRCQFMMWSDVFKAL